jgi:hypothetical protein
MKRFLLASCAVALSVTMAKSDDIADALQSAMDAYEEGDTQYALEELEFAKQLLMALKTDALVEFLPAAPDGWERTVNTEMNAGLSFMGGGTGAEATYEGEGQSITVTLMADNPIVAGMAGMIGNATLMGAKIERVGREKFMVQEGEINGLVDNRILVKASGGNVETMLELLETMDFRELGRFGS